MKKYDVIENTSKRYFNGSVWRNNDGEAFTIIAKINEKLKNGAWYYLCQFEDGNVVKATPNHIYDGQIKNPYTPSLWGIGYIGDGKWQSCINYKRTKEYNLWIRMMGCCYNPKDKSYSDYGAKGVRVDDRWHNFQQFCDDISDFENYENWKNTEAEYALDKDIICDKKNISPKIYSKDTCQFITFSENSTYAGYTHKTYIAHRIKDGYEEEFLYGAHFAKKYDIHQTGISACLVGRAKSHRGWRFRVKEN